MVIVSEAAKTSHYSEKTLVRRFADEGPRGRGAGWGHAGDNSKSFAVGLILSCYQQALATYRGFKIGWKVIKGGHL